jgi:outer membrane protease
MKRSASLAALGWTFFALALLAAPKPAFAGPVKVSTTTGFGALYGSAYEYVYNQYLSSNYENSELYWPLHPLLYARAGLSTDFGNGLSASLGVKQGFSTKAGTMTDSDFLNGDGVKTHYSESDGYAERATIVDASVAFRVLRRGGFSLLALGEFSYADFKWSARDGYYQYPGNAGQDYTFGAGGLQSPGTWEPWSAGETKTPLYGTGIIYEASYIGVSLGLRGEYALDRFSIGADFAVSPILNCYTTDNHLLRQIDFTSTLSGGVALEPRLRLAYALSQRAGLELGLSYRASWGLKGDLSSTDTGTSGNPGLPGSTTAGPASTTTFKSGSGASYSAFDASLCLRLYL